MPFGRLGLGFGFTSGGTGGLFDLYLRGYGDSTMEYNWSQYTAAGEAAFLAAATGYAGTVEFEDGAESGSYLSQLAAVAGGATVNKAWVNDTGALADANQITTKIVNLSGEVSYGTLSLGINDHSYLVGVGVDATEFQAMYEYLATRNNAVKGSKIMLNTLGRDTGGNNAGANIVRRAQLNAISNSALIERGVDTYDLEQTDAKHYTQAGQEEFATRIAARTEFLTGNDRVIRGLGASATAVLKTDEIELNLTHVNGTDITEISSGAGGMDVEDDGTAMVPTFAERLDATTIRLNFDQGKAPVDGSVVEAFIPYGCNGNGLSTAAPDVYRDNSALALPIQSDIIVPTNGDPIQVLDDLVLYWDARGSVKTQSGVNVTSIAKIAGTIASMSQVAAGDHMSYDQALFTGRGGCWLFPQTRMLYTGFTPNVTQAIGFTIYCSDSTLIGTNNLWGFTNSGGSTDTNARCQFSTSDKALYWNANEASGSTQITPAFVSGRTYYVLLAFNNDTSAQSFVMDSEGNGSWTTAYASFDPRDSTDYENWDTIVIGARSTTDDCVTGCALADWFHVVGSVPTQEQREACLPYMEARFDADNMASEAALFWTLDQYNSDYDCFVNQSTVTSDDVFSDGGYKVGPVQMGSTGFYTNARVYGGVGYLPENVVGNTFSTPDKASLDITGDIEIVGGVRMAASTSAYYTVLAGKRAASQDAYQFTLTRTSDVPANRLRLNWWDSGGALKQIESTVSPTITANVDIYFKVTLDVDNGAAGHTVTFYTSPDNINWTILGTPVVTAGTTSIRATTAPLYVGTDGALGSSNAGYLYAAIYNGIGGTKVAEFDPSAVSDFALSWAASTGETWTVTRSAVADTNDPTFLRYAGQPYVYLPGISGNYVSTPDSAIIDITANIDIVARVQLPSYSSVGSDSAIVGKRLSAAQINYQLYFNPTGTLGFAYSPDNVAIKVTSTAAIPAAANQVVWVRGTRNASTGVFSGFYSLQDTQNVSDVVWIANGTSSTAIENMATNSSPLEIGSIVSGTGNLLTGRVYYAEVRSTIGGSAVAKFDASLSSQTGYTDSLNSTVWTISRATNGKKAVLVDRHTLVLGTDDYMVVGDHPLVNFSATDSFALGVATRGFANINISSTTQAKLMEKFAGSYTTPGWSLYYNTGVITTGSAYTYGGAATTNSAGVTQVAGTPTLASMVRSVSADTLVRYANTNATSLTDSSTSTLSNTGTIQIGRDSGGASQYLSAEITGGFIARSALTPNKLLKLKSQLGAF